MQSFSVSLPGRALALLLVLTIVSIGCNGTGWLDAEPGLPDNHGFAVFAVPGGYYNAANANLSIRRVEMVLDTPVGAQGVSALYNSASGEWLWSFQIAYDGAEFTDPTGAVYDVSAVPAGAAIPGSLWVKVDGTTIATKGGLEHHFDESGRLDYVAWRNLPYPRIEYTWSSDWLEVAQCVSEAMPVELCPLLFTISLGDGDPVSIVNERTGDEAVYQYDLMGRLELAQSPFELSNGLPGTQYEYGLTGTLLSAITNSEGERIEYDWQAGRRISSVRRIGEGDPTYRFSYTISAATPKIYGTIVTNPLGGVTKYYIDAERRLREILRLPQDGSDERLLLKWTGARPHELRDFDGTTTLFTYVDDDIATLTQPSGNLIRITYAPTANHFDEPFVRPIEYVEDSVGLIEERSYDAQGRLETVANGEGELTAFTYNPASAVASITDPFGVTNSFPVYGIHGHWLDLEGPVPDHRAFDPVGNVVVASVVRERGGFVTRSYDANRNLAALDLGATDTLGHVTATGTVSISRRSDGRITYISRPGGGDHAFTYDALGRPVEERERVDGQWRVTTFEYDGAGHPTARTRPNGMREELEYDGYGRITRHRALRDGVLEGEAVLSYAAGQLASLYDSVRDTTEFYTYDEAGRLATTLYSSGETLLREYDLRSRLTRERFEIPGVGTVAEIGYEYDLANRQARVTDGLAQELLVERTFQDGKLATTRYGNGLRRDRAYDPASGRLVGLTTTDALEEVVEATSVSYTFEQDPPRQQIRTATDTPLASTEEEYWLGIGGSLANPDQLVGKRVFGWSDGNGASRAFAYDELGNRVSDPSENAFTYNAERNRLLSATLAGGGPTLDYSYDEAGFATSRGGVPITWTATGRMASFGADTLEWDLEGRLVSLSVQGVEREFRLFGGRIEGDPASGTLGALDLGEVSIHLATGERLYRHFDFRTNVSFVSDDAGEIVNHYGYSPFGVASAFGAGENDRTFVRKSAAGEVIILGFRIYDPRIGRFLSPDPVLDVVNQYAYTLGDPIHFLDASGLFSLSVKTVIAMFAVVAVGGLIVAAIPATAAITVGSTTLGVAGTSVALAATSVGALLGLADAVLEDAGLGGLEGLAAKLDGAADGIQGASSSGMSLPNFGSGPCKSRCGPPSGNQKKVVIMTPAGASSFGGSSNTMASPGASCSPVEFGASPGVPLALIGLIAVQFALGLLMLRGRRDRRRWCC